MSNSSDVFTLLIPYGQKAANGVFKLPFAINLPPLGVLAHYVFRNLNVNNRIKIVTLYDIVVLDVIDHNNDPLDYQDQAVEKNVVDAVLNFRTRGSNHEVSSHYSPTCQASSALILSTEEISNVDENSYYSIKGLSFPVWMTFFVAGCLVSFILPLVAKNLEKRIGFFEKLVENAWFFISDILQNPSSLSFALLNGKSVLIFIGWILASFVLMKAYSGSLQSELIAKKKLHIDVIEDVLERKEVVPIIRAFSQFASLLKLYNEGLYGKLKKEIDLRGIMVESDDKNEKEFYQALGSKKIAYFVESWEVDNYVRNLRYQLPETKKFYLGKHRYEEKSFHMLFSKNLSRGMLERADYLFSRSFETRQLDLYYKHASFLMKDLTDTSEKVVNEVAPFTVKALLPAYEIWLFGLLAAILALIAEISPLCLTKTSKF